MDDLARKHSHELYQVCEELSDYRSLAERELAVLRAIIEKLEIKL